MKRKIFSAGIAFLLLLLQCGCSGEAPSSDFISNSSLPARTNREITEQFFDYSRDNSYIGMILSESGVVTDEQMAVYAVAQLSKEGRYDMENGNPIADYDEITEKYFGKKIQNFQTSITYLSDDESRVLVLGFGLSGMLLVLHDMKMTEENRWQATFYGISQSPGTVFPDEKTLRHELFSGQLENYGTIHFVQLVLEEKADDEGYYWLIHSAKNLGETKGPFVLYS